MKRLCSLILVSVLLAGLCACGRKEKPGVTYPTEAPLPCTIRTDTLTQAESDRLPDAGETAQSAVFSFTAQAHAGGLKLILYRLENGVWEDIAGGSWQDLTALSPDSAGVREGKLCLRFDNLWEPFTAVLLTETAAAEIPLDAQGPDTQANSETVFLAAQADAAWQQTIPLALQVVSHQDRILPPGLDIWEHPELYEDQGFEDVYLLALSLQAAQEN